jgi:hypothetical protein
MKQRVWKLNITPENGTLGDLGALSLEDSGERLYWASQSNGEQVGAINFVSIDPEEPTDSNTSRSPELVTKSYSSS